MQIVKPIDIEDALRIDLAALLGQSYTVCAQPAPDDLSAGTVCVTCAGGAAQGVVANDYGIVIDCWGSTPAEAIELANLVHGYLFTLPIRVTSSAVYTTVNGNNPYLNPDPRRPILPRATFTANVGARGVSIL